MRKKAIVVATGSLLTLIGAQVVLAQQECQKLALIAEYVNVPTPSPGDIAGLDGATAVAISPDGACVYAASDVDDAIAVFSRNPATGALTYVENISDGDMSGVVNGLNGAAAVVVTPDNASGNAFVYVAGYVDDLIAVFEQQTNSCALNFVTAFSHNDLNGPRGLALSPDGGDLFVASGAGSGTLVSFMINANGTLSHIQTFVDNDNLTTCLQGAFGVAASADGECVYVTAAAEDAVCVFNRDAASGLLWTTQDFRYDSNVAGSPTLLNDPRAVATSPDDLNVYVTAHADDAITVATRQAPHLADQNGCDLAVTQELQNSTSLNGATGVAVHPAGTRVYVGSELADMIEFYKRDLVTGALSSALSYHDATKLNAVRGVATDGTHLYTANHARDSVAAFVIDDCCGDHVVQTNETCDDAVCCTSDCTTPINLGVSCDADANLCTAGDACNAAGKCVAGPCAIGAACDKPCNGGPGTCQSTTSGCLCQ